MPTSPAVNRRLPLRLLTFAIVVTAAVLAWLGWSGYRSQRLEEEYRQRTADIERWRWSLVNIDELLALEVRAAAATGDAYWLGQYEFDQSRQAALLEKVLALAPERSGGPARERIREAYDLLSSQRAELLQHLAEGRLPEAQAIYYGEEYRRHTTAYEDALATYIAWLQAADGAFPEPPDPTLSEIAAGMLSLAFLVAGWCAVMVNMRRWQTALVTANEELARQKASLEELNATLDQRVAEGMLEAAASHAEAARQAKELERANEELVSEIAKHQRTEAALHREQDLLHALLESIPDNIYFKDREGRYLRINRAKAIRSGLECPEDAIGKSDFDFFPPEHARQALADEQRVMETGQPIVGKEERLVWPSGEVTWSSTTKTPFREPDGTIVGTLGVSRDITAQKHAEEQLRAHARRTQLILDTAREAFVGMDSDGRIIEWNAHAEAIFGWSRAEALGQSVAETIVPPLYRPEHLAGLARFRETGEGPVLNQRIELSAINREGQEFSVELSVTPLQLNGEWCFYAFLHDITRRKRQEDELRRAKEAAEAANRAKSDFLANMSHEIRTPMNAIIGMTDLVLDTDLNDLQREYLQMVQVSGESLLTIINDILDYSKIEAGKLELAAAPFSLRRCVGDTLKALALRAHSKDLELAWRVVEPTPDHLIGDADRLRQVMVNLVGNAIKFTEKGEVVLEVACTERTAEAVELHFQVRDTGIGVPADKLETIFHAFEQADNSSTRRFGGTGLGLTISSRLVALMGGRVWVESEVGRGSVFHFTARLPLADEMQPGPPPAVGKTLAHMRALVVDDNATNRLILAEMLRNWRIAAETAGDASEARRRLQQAGQAGERFDLLLTDLNMPDESGLDLIAWMRREEPLRETAVLVLSSADRMGDVARCRELGVARRMTKPVKQSELLDAVLEALKIERVEPEAATAPPSAAPETSSSAPPGEAAPPLNVLLVEDSFFNQKLAIGLLEKKGHRVTVADNGKEALRQLEEGDFDVVLMDVRMPEMDGLAATAAIREREKKTGGHMPIIAMTAHAMTGDREKCLEAGMDGYLSKPVRAAELYVTLDSLVRQHVHV